MMKVGFFQYPVIWRDRQANLDYIASNIKNLQFDLLVLPELFTSGYAADTQEELMPFAEQLHQSETIKALTNMMQQCQGYIVGSIPEWDNGHLYNTAITVGAEGLVNAYRKIHLPDYEKRFFTAGNHISTYPHKKARIGTAICFDCWFAPLTAQLKQQGADIICYPSCFGGAVTPTIIPIRALENQCFIISCNRIGSEIFDGISEDYIGKSQIVSPDGNILASADGEESLTLIHIDLKEVNNPAFGSLITQDFATEHQKYNIELKPTNNK